MRLAKRLRIMPRFVAIHFLYYNFGRIHKTLIVTPAMAAELPDHVVRVAPLNDIAQITKAWPPARKIRHTTPKFLAWSFETFC
jgi:hypothetical protein